MMSAFDPYAAWLDVPPGPRPPAPHALLGLMSPVADAATIEAAVQQQIARVRQRAPVEAVAETRQIIREIMAARTRLLDGRTDWEGAAGVDRMFAPGPQEFDAPSPGAFNRPTRERMRTLTLPRSDSPGTNTTPAAEREERENSQPAAKEVRWHRAGTPRVVAAVSGFVVAALGLFLLLMAPVSQEGDAEGSVPETGIPAVAVPRDVPFSPVDVAPAADEPHEPAVAERPPEIIVPVERVAVLPPEPIAIPVAVAEVPEMAPAIEGDAEPLAVERLYRAPLPRDPADHAPYLDALREMMAAGFGAKGDALARAEQQFAASQRFAPGDPRAHFAWGVVQWRRYQYVEALDQFELSLGPPGRAYWPGWQARLWLTLARKEIPRALSQAVEMAREFNASTLDEEARQYCAEWLGRVMGYLAIPDNDLSRDFEAVAQAQDEIAMVLSGELRRRYELGRSSVHREYDDLRNETDATLDRIAADRKKASEQEQSEIASERERRQDEVEKLEMTAEKWKAWIDEQMKIHEEALSKLVDEFAELGAQADGVATSIDRLNFEIIAIEQQMVVPPGGGPARNQAQLEQEHFIKTTLRDQLRSQYVILDRRAAGVRAKALEVQQHRAADVNRYRKATGELITDSDALQKWNAVLNRREQALGKPSKSNSAEGRAAQRRLTAFSTYVPLEPNVERQRLLKALDEEQDGL